MPSYCAAIGFLLQRSVPTAAKPGGDGIWGVSTTRPEWAVPAAYNCKISKVGDPARKVFMADGSKFSTYAVAPDSDLSITGSLGGAFADLRPDAVQSRLGARPYPRQPADTGVDTRIYWARHSGRAGVPGGKSGTFRFNIAFFDGHVETVDDLTGANPFMWWPKGTETHRQLYPTLPRPDEAVFPQVGQPTGGKMIIP
jgi:prepilin-type processing-associated H-X9-DG protein